MKYIKTLSIVILLFLTVVLSACNITISANDDAAKVKEAKDSLILTDKSNVKGDFTLPSLGKNNVEITWVSSNTDVVSISSEKAEDGSYTATVTRPEVGSGNSVLLLTATLTLNEETATKDFDVRVIEAAPIVGGTVSNVLELEKGTEAVLNDVVVYGIINGGYYVCDETGYIYVYGTAPEELAVGDKINIAGVYDVYSGVQPEMKDINSLEIVSSDNSLPTPAEVTIADILAYDMNEKTNIARYVTITGIVTIEGDYNNAYISDIQGNKVIVYYNSNQDAVKAFEGKTITLDVVIHTYHTGDHEWRMSYVKTQEDIIEVTLTDEEKVSSAKSLLSVPEEIGNDLTLTFESNGVTIDWASDNAAIAIDNAADTVTVTRPAIGESDVTVTLTANLSLNEETDTQTFTVIVKACEIDTVSEVLAKDDDSLVTLTGVVSGLNETYGYFIQDEDGTAIYVKGDHGVTVGDKVIVTGTLNTNTNYGNNQKQIESATLDSTESTGNTVYLRTDLTASEIVSNHATYSSQLIRLINLEFIKEDDYGYLFFKGNDTVSIKFKATDYGVDASTWTAGEIIAELTFNVYDINFDNLRVQNVTLTKDSTNTPVSVNDALAQADETVVTIKGIVSGLNGTYGYFIQDADGTAIYVKKGHNVDEGDEVIITGTLETYTDYSNNQRRLKSDASLYGVLSTGNTLYVYTNISAQQIADDIGAYSSQLVTLSNVTVTDVDDGFDYVHITSGSTMNLKFKPTDFDIDVSSWEDGETISSITFNVYDVSFNNIRIVNVTLTK